MAAGKRSEADTIAIQERRKTALGLRRGGSSYRQIADVLHVSHTQIRSDIKAALALGRDELKKTAVEFVALEMERLDGYLVSINQQVANGHLGAIDRALRIMDMRISLLEAAGVVKKRMDLTSDDKPLSLLVQGVMDGNQSDGHAESYHQPDALP